AAGASVEPRLRRAESGESGALARSHCGAKRALSRLSTFLPNGSAPEGGARVLPSHDPGYRLDRNDESRRHRLYPLPVHPTPREVIGMPTEVGHLLSRRLIEATYEYVR